MIFLVKTDIWNLVCECVWWTGLSVLIKVCFEKGPTYCRSWRRCSQDYKTCWCWMPQQGAVPMECHTCFLMRISSLSTRRPALSSSPALCLPRWVPSLLDLQDFYSNFVSIPYSSSTWSFCCLCFLCGCDDCGKTAVCVCVSTEEAGTDEVSPGSDSQQVWRPADVPVPGDGGREAGGLLQVHLQRHGSGQVRLSSTAEVLIRAFNIRVHFTELMEGCSGSLLSLEGHSVSRTLWLASIAVSRRNSR